MYQQPFVQAPAVCELRRPCFEGNGITDEPSEALIIQPTDRFFVRLDADRNAVVARTGLSLDFASITKHE